MRCFKMAVIYIHGYGTTYAAKQNLYKFGVRTNVEKQSLSFIAIDIWKDHHHQFPRNGDIQSRASSGQLCLLFYPTGLSCLEG